MERGYVLHHRPYKEANVLVNLLVDGHGRIDAVARLGSGRRSIKSILQPFQPLIFEFSGKSELKNLTQVEAGAPPVPLAGHGLYAGMYLNELLVRTLSVHHGAENLFITYHQALMAMAARFCQSQLRYFEQSLLHELGAMPSLAMDAAGDPLEAVIYYRWVAEEGFWPTLATHASNSFSGASLMALEQHTIEATHFAELKQLMRLLLHPLLGNKPLLSRQLFSRSVHAKAVK
ncbi:DNA repair protein RecO [Shewanella salipaludis]|uniref:DNA repair protein RecO n=1 Tax=Shewanella salipaludis TaxID=2723052 RepID=A0A972FSB4_9GAMM|nr:DNA repair protein RecO [Shewanella salipaludis]NMH64782.1 DNA repair protein RecO [Shewanella salipaludis]